MEWLLDVLGGEVPRAVALGFALLTAAVVATWLVDRLWLDRLRERRVADLAGERRCPCEHLAVLVADTQGAMGDVQASLAVVRGLLSRAFDTVMDVDAWERAEARHEFERAAAVDRGQG